MRSAPVSSLSRSARNVRARPLTVAAATVRRSSRAARYRAINGRLSTGLMPNPVRDMFSPASGS